eukprot:12103194-Karenia_brevis.AAC.1
MMLHPVETPAAEPTDSPPPQQSPLVQPQHLEHFAQSLYQAMHVKSPTDPEAMKQFVTLVQATATSTGIAQSETQTSTEAIAAASTASLQVAPSQVTPTHAKRALSPAASLEEQQPK